MQCTARIAIANERIENPPEEAVFAGRVREEDSAAMLARLLELELAREGV